MHDTLLSIASRPILLKRDTAYKRILAYCYQVGPDFWSGALTLKAH
jgi:hypothetical protein